MTTLAAAVHLFIGALAGFWVGASASLWRRILRYVRRRQNRLPWHSLRGGMLYLPGERRQRP